MQDSHSQSQLKVTKNNDEFSKLKNLALELKNIQLKLLKDLNPKTLNHNITNLYDSYDSKAIEPNTRVIKLN